MRIAVGSQNSVKVEAVNQAFGLYFDELELVPVSVDSGVQPFPMSQQETLTGAHNRAQKAWEADTSIDYAVGIEAGVFSIETYFLVQGFAVVRKDDEVGLGCSVAFEVSPNLIAKIDPSSDRSKQTVEQLLGRSNIFHQEGVVGVLTQNQLTRTQILRDAVICALPRFLLPQYFIP
ncbi:MAG: inosine/xanthosine triphosphatase [Candidatus Hermodarchaeota archaeon]|nr:inosine/xanthosine triphosphatase [Candidatus Hermodarchaeota archaeon]